MIIRAIVVSFTLTCCLSAQEVQHQHSDAMHQEMMNARGEKAMGFSQTATTHHFRLLPDGGYVEVQTKDSKDVASRDLIRTHLKEQEKKFAAGDFGAPELTHDRVPPGVSAMTQLRSAIRYRYEQVGSGGRLWITSRDANAVVAIHEFLRFQIEDHKTGDTTETVRP